MALSRLRAVGAVRGVALLAGTHVGPVACGAASGTLPPAAFLIGGRLFTQERPRRSRHEAPVLFITLRSHGRKSGWPAPSLALQAAWLLYAEKKHKKCAPDVK